MADTGFRSDGNLTVKHWSASLFREAMKNIFFGRFVGSSSSSLIQTKTDLNKAAGDKVTYGLRMRLTGQGRADDQDLEGYEEALTFYDYTTTVHLRANAVKAQGKMSMRRTQFEIMSEARDGLADWMTEMIDDDTVLALSGIANSAIVDDDSSIVSAVSPSTNRLYTGGQTTAGVVLTTSGSTRHLDMTTAAPYLFGTRIIDIIKRKAQLAVPKIRPIMVEGAEHYVVFIHPFQAKALRAEAAWLDAQQNAGVRGKKNPIFSGSLGVWNNVIVHEYERILTRTGDSSGASSTDPSAFWENGGTDGLTNTISQARALFCGAQAGVHAYAQYPGWYTKRFQYGRVPGVATDIIYVASKTRFNSEDFGVIAVDTCIVDDS